MIKRILPYAVLLSVMSASAFGGDSKSAAQINLEVLDGLCVQNYEGFSNIEHMAKAFGGKPLPESIANADPVLRNMGGKSYFIPYEGNNYIVAYVKGGGCTVISKNIDPEKMRSLITENYKAKLVHTENSGIQVNTMYVVTGNTLHKGAMFSLVYGKKATGFSEGSIGFIPAKVANRARGK